MTAQHAGTAVGYAFDALGVRGFVRAATRNRARFLVALGAIDAGYFTRREMLAALREVKVRRAKSADAAPVIDNRPEGLVPNTWSPA